MQHSAKTFVVYEEIFAAAVHLPRFEEFKKHYHDIRKQLKFRKYLLDVYIHRILGQLIEDSNYALELIKEGKPRDSSITPSSEADVIPFDTLFKHILDFLDDWRPLVLLKCLVILLFFDCIMTEDEKKEAAEKISALD